MKHGAKIAGQARHWIGFVGAALVFGGYADGEAVQAIIGGVVALIALVSSWKSKAKNIGEGDFGG